MIIKFGGSILPGFYSNGECSPTSDGPNWIWKHPIGACDTQITRTERFVDK